MNRIIESAKFVVDNSQHVKINLKKVEEFCELWFDSDQFILKPELNSFLNLNEVLLSSKAKLNRFK